MVNPTKYFSVYIIIIINVIIITIIIEISTDSQISKQ